MRLLFLTTEFPWPATSGGPVRTLSQLRTLSALPEVERITLLSVSERPVTEAGCRELAEAVGKLDVRPPIHHPVHLWRHPRHVPRVVALRALGVPYLAAKWDSPALRTALRRELRDASIDLAYIDHLGMARYLAEIRAGRPAATVVLEQHNVESEFYAQLAEGSRGLMRWIAGVEGRAAAHFERLLLQSVDRVVAISGDAVDHFQRVADVRAHLVPVAVELERRPRLHPGRPHFCYVGNLSWRPNVAGLDWFCAEVWPRIRARIPDVTMEIAGAHLDLDARGKPLVPHAWRVPGVETAGFLEELEPLYRRSLAVLAPVCGGSGVRIKVLEGLRAGLPVVTTGDGASGLGVSDGKEVLIADDADAFAGHVESLVCDEALRSRLREAGYAFLEQYHSPAAARRALRAALGRSHES